MIRQDLVEHIYELYKTKKEKDKTRGHLGGSVIGHECRRAIFYSFRFACQEGHSGQTLRLFERGNREEPWIIQDLIEAFPGIQFDPPIKIEDLKTEKPPQIEVRDPTGHFGGSMDGKARGFPGDEDTWYLLEFKTHGDSNFKKLLRFNSVREAMPRHYAQLQTYMGLGKLTKAMYIAVNKNSDEFYLESVDYDPLEFEKLRQRALGIMLSEVPPHRISERENFYICTRCHYKDVCFGRLPPKINCRTCKWVSPLMNAGEWQCNNPEHPTKLTLEEQKVGCKSWEKAF